jgi:HEXXH motif-containing protein
LATDLRLVDRPATSDESALLDRALALLDVGDGLGQTLRALVRRVHIVESDGPGFDTSHSDPELPFSIFVSIPIGEKEGALRLAESILHEAMHLHLTLIEAQTQLVEDALAVGYSPWQHRQRPLSGLIHGLFVFRGIEEWLLRLAAMSPNETSILAYAERRRAEIAQEIDLLAWLSHAAGLTSAGTRLVTHLLRQSEGQQANLPPSR